MEAVGEEAQEDSRHKATMQHSGENLHGCDDDEDVSFLRELERENQALELELKAIQDSYVEKAQKSYTNMI